MEQELDNEFTIEPWLSQIISQSHDIKLGNVYNKCKSFANHAFGENFCENFIKYLDPQYLPSGSIMEGSAFVRNLNPNFENYKMEQEVDIMDLLAKILKNRSREVIVDLTYAKGFAWIRYEPECFGLASEGRLKKFFIQHVDGNIYLNSKTIRDASSSTIRFPELCASQKTETQGPSKNLEINLLNLEIPSKDLLDEVTEVFHECVQFIKTADEHLKQFHETYLTELEMLKKTMQDNPELINVTDIEELASVVLPKNKEKKNIFLQIYWQLLAFINEVLFTTHTIEKMKKRFQLEKLGIYSFFLRSPICSISTKKVSESLDEYFKYLLDTFPGQVLQKYRKLPSDGLSYFFQKCKLEKARDLFRALNEFESRLSVACGILKFEIKQTDNPKHLSQCCGSFDFVPAITVEDWPAIADEWQKRFRQWPPMSLVEEIVMKGCHIVPKPYLGQERNELLDWRWSFSLAETILASNRTKEMDVSYFVLKSIFYRYLKPIEHNGKTPFSYLIKTVMLWQCEEHDDKWWSNESIMSCIFALLDRLKMSFFNKCLPHYFIRDINLFDNVAEELVLYGQAILDSICADPPICIREVLEKHFGKAPRNTKENKQSEPELMPDFPEVTETILNILRQLIKENSPYSKSASFKGIVKLLEGFSNEDHVSFEVSEDYITLGSEKIMNLMETVADEIFYSMSLAEDLTSNTISELNTDDITLD